MKVESNRSAYHPTAKLLPLIDFVIGFTKTNHLANLQIVDAKAENFSSGHAWKVRKDLKDLKKLKQPALVKIRVSHGLKYPFTNQYVDEVSPITLQNFREEFVLVLAHELRHVDQFWGLRRPKDAHQIEVDAEEFAVKVLEQYRRS